MKVKNLQLAAMVYSFLCIKQNLPPLTHSLGRLGKSRPNMIPPHSSVLHQRR